MTNTVIVTSVVELSQTEISALRKALKLSEKDTVVNRIDKTLVAGLKITTDGKTVDLSVKRQLGEI